MMTFENLKDIVIKAGGSYIPAKKHQGPSLLKLKHKRIARFQDRSIIRYEPDFDLSISKKMKVREAFNYFFPVCQ